MINKTYWLIDESLNESRYQTGFPTLADAAEELGHKVHRVKHKPFTTHPFIDEGAPFHRGACVVTHGTIQFCKNVERHYGRWWTPALYFNDAVKNFYRYANYYDDMLLNEDFVIMPYGEFIRWLRSNADDFFESSWFIKPESGLKDFVGQVINTQTLDDDLKKLTPYEHGVDPQTLCVIASPKNILAEFRYVICAGHVVAKSEYRWDNVLDVRIDTHPICDALAHKVAQADFQIDTVYVCDIALLSGDRAKIIEMNAFSSSGLYACNTYDIVKAVSQAAENEYRGVE